MKGPEKRLVFWFLTPALLLYSVFMVIPGVRALGYSLQRWNGFTEAEWIGLENFAQLFRERGVFVAALMHNVFIILVGGVCVVALALLFAALIHRRVRGARLFRVAFFFPNVMSAVAIALLWVLLYSTTDFGVINRALMGIDHALGWVGLSLGVDLPFPFTDSRYLLYAIIPMLVWMATGFYMILFLAGMENIPESLYEAAKIDGASGIHQFAHITLPLLREILVVAAVFMIIGGLKFFDIIWVMESGWPTPDTHVMATLLYQKVFSEYDVGYGAAIAVVLFVIIFLASLVTLRMSRREALEF